jgi:hypothetical protein
MEAAGSTKVSESQTFRKCGVEASWNPPAGARERNPSLSSAVARRLNLTTLLRERFASAAGALRTGKRGGGDAGAGAGPDAAVRALASLSLHLSLSFSPFWVVAASRQWRRRYLFRRRKSMRSGVPSGCHAITQARAYQPWRTSWWR